jgi:hypothetical protein
MLLEELVEQHRKGPAYDWNAYYRWYFRQLGGRESAQRGFWFCERCLRVNVFAEGARYAKCPGCQTLRPRFGPSGERTGGEQVLPMS